MHGVAKRILWVDDEVELLEPHLLFLRQRGYEVDTTANGDDALALLRAQRYDLVLLDEHMPGRRGLDVLAELRREGVFVRVVMMTKSDEDRTMVEAIGRQVDDYLIKPASPRQLLSVVTRLLEGSQLRQQRAAQDFASRFAALLRECAEARDWRDYFAIYDELVDWELRLRAAGELGLADSLGGLFIDVRRQFGAYVAREYGGWTDPAAAVDEDRPPLSVDIVERYVAPALERGPVVFVVLDCLRLDQWRGIRPLLLPDFDLDEALYCSILPTATPYARNALFSGLFPDAIARRRPDWWTTDEGSLNAFEDALLEEQLRRLVGRTVPIHYEKIFTDREADEVVARTRSVLRSGGIAALVFSFVDLLTHGRSESAVLLEVARDDVALRALTRQWFERSAVRQVLKEAAFLGVPAVVTTDHGALLCERPATVYARRDATTNLRYKFGQDLRAEQPGAVFAIDDPRVLRFPPTRRGTNYLLALEDHFFVYPTKLREYQARYRGSYLHGGVSPEEMILPVAVLTPRSKP